MAKSKKSNRSTRAAKKSSPKRKGSEEGRREESLPPADRDPVIRAIVASARHLGSENPTLFEAIRWCLTHKLYLDAAYGSDAMMRECMQDWQQAGYDSRDDLIRAVLGKYRSHDDAEDDFEPTRQKVCNRFKTLRENNDPPVDLSFMKPILEHLKEEPAGEEMSEVARATGTSGPQVTGSRAGDTKAGGEDTEAASDDRPQPVAAGRPLSAMISRLDRQGRRAGLVEEVLENQGRPLVALPTLPHQQPENTTSRSPD